MTRVRLCRERLERDGHQLVEIYSDRAVSGATLIRSGIQLLIQDASRGGFDLVYADCPQGQSLRLYLFA